MLAVMLLPCVGPTYKPELMRSGPHGISRTRNQNTWSSNQDCTACRLTAAGGFGLMIVQWVLPHRNNPKRCAKCAEAPNQ